MSYKTKAGQAHHSLTVFKVPSKVPLKVNPPVFESTVELLGMAIFYPLSKNDLFGRLGNCCESNLRAK